MKKFYSLLVVYLLVVFVVGAIVLIGIIGISGNDKLEYCLDKGFSYDAETGECIIK